jgi:hypothetical protein
LSRALSRESGILASVVRVKESTVQIELKPGVFISLPVDQVETLPPDLRMGTVVRLDAHGGGRINISRALRGEEWYVPPEGRPAVGLPLNPLLDEDSVRTWDPRRSAAWSGVERFSIGGLPNILAIPGKFDQQAWGEPVASEFIDLMRIPHPKIVSVGRDSAGFMRLEPASPEVAVGSLGIEPKTMKVQFIPLSRTLEAAQDLRWEFLSFADEPISQIADKVAHKIWSYHDRESGVWLETGGIQRKRLARHSGILGPLFFERQGRELSLRYGGAVLRRFAFPVRELIRALNHKKAAWHTVAGVQAEGGLWIEIAPGRVADLPASIVVIAAETGEPALGQVHWDAFGPGDRVALRLYSTDPMTFDRIALEDWLPGARKAFGRRSILPVQDSGAESGALRLGSGEFEITLPVRWQGELPPTLQLSSENRFAVLDDRLPSPGDIVLLGLSEDGNPIVLGLPGLRPQPDAERPSSWRGDP